MWDEVPKFAGGPGVLVIWGNYLARRRSDTLALDLANGHVRRLVHEDRPLPGPGSVVSGIVSPTGQTFAFGRSHGYGWDGGPAAGIWLLDLTSGDCAEVTFEPGRPDYCHQPIAWAESDILLFWRLATPVGSSDPQWDIYSADIRVASPVGK